MGAGADIYSALYPIRHTTNLLRVTFCVGRLPYVLAILKVEYFIIAEYMIAVALISDYTYCLGTVVYSGSIHLIATLV